MKIQNVCNKSRESCLFQQALHKQMKMFRYLAVYNVAPIMCNQEKAYQEQESIFQGSDRSVTMRDLSEMKYLERVIKETLRLYPSVPGVGRTLSEDIKMGNTYSMQSLLCQYSEKETQ